MRPAAPQHPVGQREPDDGDDRRRALLGLAARHPGPAAARAVGRVGGGVGQLPVVNRGVEARRGPAQRGEVTGAARQRRSWTATARSRTEALAAPPFSARHFAGSSYSRAMVEEEGAYVRVEMDAVSSKCDGT